MFKSLIVYRIAPTWAPDLQAAEEALESWADSIGAGGVESLRGRQCLHRISEPAGEYPPLPGRTVDELTESQHESAIAAYRAAHGNDPDIGFAPDRSWLEGAAYADATCAMRAAQHAVVMLGEQAELRRLSDCCPELNLSNYGPDDVDELNGWAIEVSQCIDRALAAQHAGAQEPGAAYAEMPDSLICAVDQWFADNIKDSDGCTTQDVRELAEIFYGVAHEGGRESVDDALAIVKSFGPGIGGINDTYARQVLLAEEVERLRGQATNAKKTGELLMGLAVIRELTGTQQKGLEETIEAVRAAVNAQKHPPAPATLAVNDDLRDRLVAISEAIANQDDRAAQAMLREILKAPQADSQPAPQQEAQEPFAWHVCSVNSDGSLSLEHAAAWEEAAHEHINDAITEHDIEGAGSWVVRPAYHAPQPSPAAQGDARSMLRIVADYSDWLDSKGRLTSFSTFVNEFGYEERDCKSVYEIVVVPCLAARAAQEGKSHG